MGDNEGTAVAEHVVALFKHKWDREILDALAERPYRFGELNARVQAATGSHLADRTQTRTLEKLRGQGLVDVTAIYEGRRRVWQYHLTDRGARIVNARWAVLAAYQRAMTPEQKCLATCPWPDVPLLHHVARAYPAVGPAATTRRGRPAPCGPRRQAEDNRR